MKRDTPCRHIAPHYTHKHTQRETFTTDTQKHTHRAHKDLSLYAGLIQVFSGLRFTEEECFHVLALQDTLPDVRQTTVQLVLEKLKTTNTCRITYDRGSYVFHYLVFYLCSMRTKIYRKHAYIFFLI